MNIFPNRVEMYPDESLDGFVYRLAFVNHHEVKDLGLKVLKDDDQEKIDYYLHQVSQFSGLTITEQQLVPYRWYLKGLTLPQWKRMQYTRFCPTCLLEKTYHRAHWCLAHHTYCFRHKTFLLDSCLYCNRKLKIEDVTRGTCTNCGMLLRNSDSEEIQDGILYLNQEGTFNSLDSPSLNHYLNPSEQLQLTQWLSYNLVDKTNYFNIQISSTEKKRLAFNGYFHEAKQQYIFMSLAYQLLTAWPLDLLIFLRDRHKNQYEYAYKFLKDFIYRMRNKKIKNVLMKTFGREQEIYRMIEHRDMYLNYLYVNDLMEIYNICHQQLHEILEEYQLHLTIHPRNDYKLINKDFIPKILKEVELKQKNIEYVSLNDAAEIWGLSNLTICILCEMFQINTMTLLGDETCYHLQTLIELKDQASKYITTDDLSLISIWSRKTLRRFLKKMKVPVIFESKEKILGYLYKKDDVLDALQYLSNNKNNFVPGHEAIRQLGYDLFKAARLDPYYPSGSEEEKPYYLKTDVKKIEGLYEQLKNVKQVGIYRQNQIAREFLSD